ncbi:MAG: MFS transporter [Rubricella sp.]
MPQRRNRIVHIASLAASKTADGLMDAKLVLSWLIGAIGAPAALVGLLVPIREAGALLPQIFIAVKVNAARHRKWLWAGGAAGQALGALIVAFAAWFLGGVIGGWTILAGLTIAALSRAICSTTYKDVLGRTVGEDRRGRVTGRATAAGAVGVVLFAAVLLITGEVERLPVVATAITLAAAFWGLAAALFTLLDEPRAEGEDPDDPGTILRVLFEEPVLARFVAVRGLLTATALSPPFLIAAGGGEAPLPWLLLASAAAGASSGAIWGALSDRSTRLTLALSGAVAGALLLVAAVVPDTLASATLLPFSLLVILVAHQGVRISRSTHLANIAPEDGRAAWTAASNLAIGIVLVLAGGLSAIAAIAGTAVVLAILGAMAILGAAGALRLERAR